MYAQIYAAASEACALGRVDLGAKQLTAACSQFDHAMNRERAIIWAAASLQQTNDRMQQEIRNECGLS